MKLKNKIKEEKQIPMRLQIRGTERNPRLHHRKETYLSGGDRSSGDDGFIYAAKEGIERKRDKGIGDWGLEPVA